MGISGSGKLLYSRDGSITPTRRDYTEMYMVKMDSPAATIIDVANATGIPSFSGNLVYSGDSSAYVIAVKPKRHTSDAPGLWWEVQVDYAGGVGVLSFQQSFRVYTYAGEVIQEVARYGWYYSGQGLPPPTGFVPTQQAIVNSAGDPFDPPLMAPKTNLVITIKGRSNSSNRSTFIGYITTYQNTINSTDVTIDGKSYPAFTLLMRSIQPEPVANGAFGYTIVVVYNPDSWVHRILDQGFRANMTAAVLTGYPLAGPGYRPVQQSDIDTSIPPKSPKDRAIGKPIMLNGSGTLIGGVWPYNPSGQTPIYRNYATNDYEDFTALNAYL